MAQQMNHAGLDHGLREHGPDRVGETLQPVDDGEQDVLDAAVAQLDGSKNLADPGISC